MKILKLVSISMVIFFASTATFAQSKTKQTAIKSDMLQREAYNSVETNNSKQLKGLKGVQSKANPHVFNPLSTGQNTSSSAMGSSILLSLIGCVNTCNGNGSNS